MKSRWFRSRTIQSLRVYGYNELASMKCATLLMVLLSSAIGQAVQCPPTLLNPAIEVWSASLAPDASFIWCVKKNAIAGLPIYTELVQGVGRCHGRGCPIHRARLFGSIANMDQTPSQASGLPHGVLTFQGRWHGRRCLLTGQTEPDPPLIGGPALVGRIGGVITGQLACRRRSGGMVRQVTPLVLTRVQ